MTILPPPAPIVIGDDEQPRSSEEAALLRTDPASQAHESGGQTIPHQLTVRQFYGLKATGEYVPWDYYLNSNSAMMNE